MSSWETTALRLQGNVTADSTPNPSHKSLPPLPRQKAKVKTVTGVKEVSGEEEDARTEGWKPLSLSTPILLAVIALTLLLAIAVETLAQRSASQGGLALSPTLEDIPSYARFAHLYAPTIIAVFYSMIWSWIDLDVKRMQPWFEMSKKDGATAENSLFLDYQYEFVGLVPFKAAKQKHWLTFCGGTAMVMVFWLLTPLQSALLGTQVVTETQIANITSRSNLVPLSQQVTLLDPEVLNNGYAVGWLGQPFPPFTTSEYALLPFHIKDNPAPAKVTTNWTAETMKLSTELTCWPADIRQNEPEKALSFSFLNGQGCNTTVNMRRAVNYTMYYMGYYSDAHADLYIGNPYCPKTENSTHQFLAIWARQKDMIGKIETIPSYATPKFHISAIFCQPTYYKQRVLARVQSSSLEPDDDFMQTMGPKELLTQEEFNSTAFEYLLANGVAQNIIIRDYPLSQVVEQHPRLNSTGLTKPVSNMVGYALAGRDLPITDYASMDTLEKVYNEAHQYLFSLAVNRLLTNGTEISNNTASVDYFLTGVVVSRVFATSVECLMVVIAILTGFILWICRTSPSHLPMNPSSISKYLEIFRDSPECLHALSLQDSADEKTLYEEFRQDQLRLTYDGHMESTKVTLERFIGDSIKPEDHNAGLQKGYYDPVRPLPLRRWSGLLFVLALSGAMAGLSYLKQKEKDLKGLHRPSQNFEVLQLLENYIPTVFATLVEPFWVLLNRLLCVLQPFRDLWQGKAEASRTISASYTSIPPQLVIWRALKSRHFVLVLVCAMALLGNLLAVGMGSLFNEAPMLAEYTESMLPAFNAKFDNDSAFGLDRALRQDLITTSQYSDHYYITMANLSSDTTLPPWVSKDYFFQRYDMSRPTKFNSRDVYSIPARGFGATANCTALPTRRLPEYDTPRPWRDFREVKDGDCGDIIDVVSQEIRENTFNRSTGISALEFLGTLGDDQGPVRCARTLVMGWARNPDAANINGTVDASFITCRPVFETALFNLTVNAQGHVLSYNRTSELEPSLDYEGWETHVDLIFRNIGIQWKGLQSQWHNESTARDWMNYFTVLKTGSRDALDPHNPPPDTEKLKPLVEDIYRRVFAIFLGLNDQLFDTKDEIKPTTVVRRTVETRIFMENASFIMTMTILASNVVVAILFYSRAVPFVLPRLPTTLGSVLAYVAPSRIAGPAYKAVPGNTSRTFSFGRYIGKDGEVHIGVEMDPHVVPVDPLSLQAKRSLVDRVFRRRSRPENQAVRSGTWL
ncbi:uncharacterized protein B0J16DRAFT_262795 [Fusarium flagelliforme]|uniref:uncharacterized protein n=1 Tax=Fusarium flagelliforme TaxID=2675880 RepID=UPI001E8E0D88|nr:uncharacterized protein B0J16DRAFT_262795 [Fusarium flagelliforme]KAH7192131.1 hypothetical protein B0J16DRAFT_262795 [Fusarium flagelliforme]